MDKAERHQEILDAARRVFATKGYHEAKVGDIAAAANVAKGTVYLYFADKRSIFVQLVDGLFVRLSAAILRVDPAGDVVGQIKHNIRAVLGVLVGDPDSMRMLFDHASGIDPALNAKIDSFYQGLHELFIASLEDGQRLGIVKDGDIRLYASFTIGGIKEILIRATTRPDNPRAREQIVDAIFELLQGGYLRVAGGERTERVERG